MNAKVLLLEEDAMFAAEVQRRLRALGCDVTLLREGGVGLARAVSERFDAIVVSAELPGMNGFRLCNRIKKDENASSVPLLMMGGASADGFAQHQRLPTHADAYMRKPIVLGELLARLCNLVPALRRPRGASAEREDEEIRVIEVLADLMKEAPNGAPAPTPGETIETARRARDAEQTARALAAELAAAQEQMDALEQLRARLLAQEETTSQLTSELARARAAVTKTDALNREVERLRRTLAEAGRTPSPPRPSTASAVAARELLGQRELLVKEREALTLKTELDDAAHTIADLRKSLAANESSGRALEHTLEERERQVAQLEKAIAAAHADKEEAAKRVEEQLRRADRSQPEIEQLRKALQAERARRVEEETARERAIASARERARQEGGEARRAHVEALEAAERAHAETLARLRAELSEQAARALAAEQALATERDALAEEVARATAGSEEALSFLEGRIEDERARAKKAGEAHAAEARTLTRAREEAERALSATRVSNSQLEHALGEVRIELAGAKQAIAEAARSTGDVRAAAAREIAGRDEAHAEALRREAAAAAAARTETERAVAIVELGAQERIERLRAEHERALGDLRAELQGVLDQSGAAREALREIEAAREEERLAHARTLTEMRDEHARVVGAQLRAAKDEARVVLLAQGEAGALAARKTGEAEEGLARLRAQHADELFARNASAQEALERLRKSLTEAHEVAREDERRKAAAAAGEAREEGERQADSFRRTHAAERARHAAEVEALDLAQREAARLLAEERDARAADARAHADVLHATDRERAAALERIREEQGAAHARALEALERRQTEQASYAKAGFDAAVMADRHAHEADLCAAIEAHAATRAQADQRFEAERARAEEWRARAESTAQDESAGRGREDALERSLAELRAERDDLAHLVERLRADHAREAAAHEQSLEQSAVEREATVAELRGELALAHAAEEAQRKALESGRALDEQATREARQAAEAQRESERRALSELAALREKSSAELAALGGEVARLASAVAERDRSIEEGKTASALLRARLEADVATAVEARAAAEREHASARQAISDAEAFHAQAIAEAEEQRRGALAWAMEAVEARELAHHDETQRLLAEHERSLAELSREVAATDGARAGWSAAQEELQRRAATERERELAELQDALAAARELHARELREREKGYEEGVAPLERALRDSREESDRRLGEEREGFAQKLAEIDASQQAELARTAALARAAAIEEANAERETAVAELSSRIRRTFVAEHEAALVASRAASDAARGGYARARAELEARAEGLATALANARMNLDAERRDRLVEEGETATRLDAFEALVATRDEEKLLLEKQLEEARAETPQLEAEIVVLRSELANASRQIHQGVATRQAETQQLEQDRQLLGKARAALSELVARMDSNEASWRGSSEPEG